MIVKGSNIFFSYFSLKNQNSLSTNYITFLICLFSTKRCFHQFHSQIIKNMLSFLKLGKRMNFSVFPFVTMKKKDELNVRIFNKIYTLLQDCIFFKLKKIEDLTKFHVKWLLTKHF